MSIKSCSQNSFRVPFLALNVVCCETAIRLKSGAKRKWLARAQNVTNDPEPTCRAIRSHDRQGQESGWNGATERLGSGQVDDKFEFRGLLYRKVAGLLTSEDPINICRRLSKLIDEVWTVGH